MDKFQKRQKRWRKGLHLYRKNIADSVEARASTNRTKAEILANLETERAKEVPVYPGKWKYRLRDYEPIGKKMSLEKRGSIDNKANHPMGEVAPGLIAWGIDEIKRNNSNVVIHPKVGVESPNSKYVNGLPTMLVHEIKKFKKKIARPACSEFLEV